MKIRVQAPVEGFRGDVAGIQFVDGVAEYDPVKNPGVHQYFQDAGYRLNGKVRNGPEVGAVPAPVPALVQVGTPAQDALAPLPAFDPDAPTADDMRAAVDRIAELEALLDQEREASRIALEAAAAELEAATAATGEAGDDPAAAADPPADSAPASSARPPVRATAGDWRDYAVAQGMDPVEAASLSKEKLIERFGG